MSHSYRKQLYYRTLRVLIQVYGIQSLVYVDECGFEGSRQPMGLAAVLGISAEKLQTCLNQLETHAIIEQRRTVSPAQIIRRWDDPLTLLTKAFSAQ